MQNFRKDWGMLININFNESSFNIGLRAFILILKDQRQMHKLRKPEETYRSYK
ncbi:hypothetical protein LCGC14_1461220 [marine sediment metagenome]|uniref:Uncharacterized protein n=1 Tax=marine sediment metagenome TaxID=412755 RepID=A0A0F9LVN2_9ZZZZ